jgi:hypothetical protein
MNRVEVVAVSQCVFPIMLFSLEIPVLLGVSRGREAVDAVGRVDIDGLARLKNSGKHAFRPDGSIRIQSFYAPVCSLGLCSRPLCTLHR